MTNPLPPPAQRIRIASHLDSSHFLHVEDALGIGKLRLFAGIYLRGRGMDMDSRCHSYHFLDLADVRVVFAALAQGEPGFSYREQKGSPKGNWTGAVSRSLSVHMAGGDRPGLYHCLGRASHDGSPGAGQPAGILSTLPHSSAGDNGHRLTDRGFIHRNQR